MRPREGRTATTWSGVVGGFPARYHAAMANMRGNDRAALRRRGEQLVAHMDEPGVLGGSEKRLVFGGLGLAIAIAVLAFDDSQVAGRLFAWTAILLLASLLLLVKGIEGVRRRGRRLREVHQAVTRWETLRSGFPGQANPARWMQQLGFHEFEIRRWIACELGRG